MGLLDNSGILSNPAFRVDLTVKRRQAGAWDTDSGKWLSGAPEADQVAIASVQPATFQDNQYLVLNMEGGQRLTAAIRIYSSFEFTPATVGTAAREGDVVVYKGLEWAVITVGDFSGHGHQKVLGVRIDGQDG
jgi:hypothetical protein